MKQFRHSLFSFFNQPRIKGTQIRVKFIRFHTFGKCLEEFWIGCWYIRLWLTLRHSFWSYYFSFKISNISNFCFDCIKRIENYRPPRNRESPNAVSSRIEREKIDESLNQVEHIKAELNRLQHIVQKVRNILLLASILSLIFVWKISRDEMLSHVESYENNLNKK